MTSLLEEPARDAVTLQNYEYTALRNALTLRITFRKIHLTALLFDLAESYNSVNAAAIENGSKESATADSPLCRSLAPQYLRHEFTNYDDLWKELGQEVRSSHVHQIVYCRTMRIIRDAYPELRWIVEQHVNRKYPLDTRLPVCMPTKFEDVVRDVKRIESERREVELQEGKVGYGELTDKALKAAVIEHILNTQTYLNEQRPAVLSDLPAEQRDARAEQLRQDTLNIVYLAYPELERMGKPSSIGRSSKATAVPPAFLNRRLNLAKTPKGDPQAWASHLAKVLKKEIPASVLDTSAEVPELSPPLQKEVVPRPEVLSERDLLWVERRGVPIAELLESTVCDFNNTSAVRRGKKMPLSLTGDMTNTRRLQQFTARSAAKQLIKHHPAEDAITSLELVGDIYPELRLGVDLELMLVRSRFIAESVRVTGREVEDSDLILIDVPLSQLRMETLANLERKKNEGHVESSMSPTGDPQLEVDIRTVSLLSGDYSNSSHLIGYCVRDLADAEKQVRAILIRAMLVRKIQSKYPELSEAAALHLKHCVAVKIG